MAASSSNKEQPHRTFLDGPGARILAAAIIVAAASVLGYLHREDIAAVMPGKETAAVSAADTPLAKCLAERTGSVDRMLEEGVIDSARHALFRQRAEALCQSQFGG